MKTAWARFRGWPTWVQWVLGVFVALIVIGALAPGDDDDEQPVSAGQASTTQATLSHVQVIPPSSAPAPTPPPTVATTTTTTTPPQPVDVATFTGSSDKNTEAFSVRSPWRIKWRITGGAGVAIALHDQSGARIEYISADPGTDESVIRRNCVGCYLKISPFGSTYTITVNGIAA